MKYNFTLVLRVLLVISILLLLVACEKKSTVAIPSADISPTLPVSAPVKSKEQKKEEKKEALKEYEKETKAMTVDTRSITGRKLGGLYADITGIEGVVETSHTVNFGELLVGLWTRKLDRKNVSSATIHAAEEPIKLFLEQPKKMKLKQFIAEADTQVTLVKRALDFGLVCKGYKLNEVECKVFKSLALDVRGVDLVAYGMTEIMPSAEGDLNVKILEILLQNAGSNYMFTIPALYDRMLSLGFYQFTSYAVNGVKNEGASRMNMFLPRTIRIPGSVIELRNGEHHRAAYLFALHNLANLSKQTNEKEFATLRKALKQKPGEIVTFMATAHHAPTPAIRSAKHWLSKGAKGTLNNHLVGRLRPYGKKSDNNLAALEKVK